jgi:hypothetical protein
MGRSSINREQCKTPDEFSIQAQAALIAIKMNSIARMVECHQVYDRTGSEIAI